MTEVVEIGNGHEVLRNYTPISGSYEDEKILKTFAIASIIIYFVLIVKTGKDMMSGRDL